MQTKGIDYYTQFITFLKDIIWNNRFSDFEYMKVFYNVIKKSELVQTVL